MEAAARGATRLDATVAVLCQDEARRIGACLASIARASRGMRARLAIVMNGTSDGSEMLAIDACNEHGLDADIYAIRHADKSNAINWALGSLRRPAGMHAFVDGYVTIGERSLHALGEAIAARGPGAATGVATNGRTMRKATAETLSRGGRLHGQLHAFSPGFAGRIAEAGIKLPIGLYRGDGLLCAMACNDLDPRSNRWDGHRVVGAPDATYEIDRLSPLRPGDVRRQFRRKVRQMHGLMENAALRQAEAAAGYGGLPRFADDLIAAWLAGGGRPRASAADLPFMALALRQHRSARRPADRDLAPTLFAST